MTLQLDTGVIYSAVFVLTLWLVYKMYSVTRPGGKP